ncbi:MAG TPA: SusE domain-containing protein [Flavobacterium sp.]|uniref:SusE domain-containing protein n=1 Tax=Flavobacterium sp. TaxID=239 RepID=UPI002B5B33B3|nr:SusE domain-containing protein [Flavobacterium sp.]HNP31880.1 SusE domain-containing protein [Flavobacterium sp.]
MKKILKISSLAFLLITGIACENDNQTIATAKGGPELIAPANGTEYVLHPLNAATSEATTLVWNHADYDVQTAVNYEVQFALHGTDFATIVSGGTTTNRFMTYTVEALNAIALQAGLTPYTAGDLDVRVKGTLGSNADLESLSNVITLTITAFTTELPKLWVPGSYQTDSGYGGDWTPASAPKLASEGFGNTNYEGYVYFATTEVAPSDGFKFTDANDWSHGIFGDDGSFSGGLTSPGGNIGVNSGYYKVTANTTTNTYALTATQWGIAGDGTSNGWDGMIPMTYNPTTKKWSVVATLTTKDAPDHGLKFKANGAWDINLGDNGADGKAEYNGTNIGTTAGTYLIELDLSNPRAYTYTLTAQ